MPKISILNILSRIIEKISDGILLETDFIYLENILEILKLHFEKWQDHYDEQEANEPETDAAHDRWEDRQEKLSERLELLETIIDDMGNCIEDISQLEVEKLSEEDLKYESECVATSLENILENLDDYNFTYRGLKSLKLDYRE